MGTELDMLVIGEFVLHKSAQNISLIRQYKNEFELD